MGRRARRLSRKSSCIRYPRLGHIRRGRRGATDGAGSAHKRAGYYARGHGNVFPRQIFRRGLRREIVVKKRSGQKTSEHGFAE